jgi:hypothetical protein
MSNLQVKTRTLVNNKGKSLDTPYTDKEAFDRLKKHTVEKDDDESFEFDLINKGQRYGLSEQQFWWVHKLLLDLENPPERPQLMGIWNAYSRAKIAMVGQRGMKRCIGIDESGESILFSVAGERSKYRGSIWVKDLDDTYLGRITNGLFYRADACSDIQIEHLRHIDERAEKSFPW